MAAGFRRYATYRRATLAGAFTNTVFGVIRVSILFAAADAAGGTVAGYDRAALSTYTWVSQGLIAVAWLFGWTTVTQRVRTGDVAIDLGRPVHPIAAWLAEDLGRAGQACLIRFFAPLALGWLLFGLRLPEHPETVPQDGSEVTVILDGRTTTTTIPAGTPVLDGAQRVRPDLPFACKGGVCGTCRAQVRAGEVRMRRNFALEDAEVAAGYVLTCQSLPVSAELTVDYDA